MKWGIPFTAMIPNIVIICECTFVLQTMHLVPIKDLCILFLNQKLKVPLRLKLFYGALWFDLSKMTVYVVNDKMMLNKIFIWQVLETIAIT